MKRYFLILVVCVLAIVACGVSFASAEGYQSMAFVKVTTCTLRNQPMNNTSKSNTMAKMKNAYSMLVVGECDGYYMVKPSSVCDENGNPLGLSDYNSVGQPIYGYVVKGHLKVDNKQFVVTTNYAYFYYWPMEVPEKEIAEKKAGERFLMLDYLRYDGQDWYIVQLPGDQAGVGYLPAKYGTIEAAAVASVPDEPDIEEEEELSIVDLLDPQTTAMIEQPDEMQKAYVFAAHQQFVTGFNDQPEADQSTTEDDEDEAEQFVIDGCARVAASYASVFTKEGAYLGALAQDTEVTVIAAEGEYTVIIFEYSGMQVKGYVLTSQLEAACFG